jgi:hypothetical protein
MVIQTIARHAGREGRSKTIEPGSQRATRQAPEPAVLEGTVLSARQWRALGRRHNAVLVGIGLAAAAHALRPYRFDERLILRLIVLAAVTRLAWKAAARALPRWAIPEGDRSFAVDGNRFMIAATATTKRPGVLRRPSRNQAP